MHVVPSAPMAVEHQTCRCRGAGALQPIFSLGSLCISDFPKLADSDGLKAPLDLVLCPACWFLQLIHSFSGDVLCKTYWYRSGTNSTLRQRLTDLTREADARSHEAGSLSIDLSMLLDTIARGAARPGCAVSPGA